MARIAPGLLGGSADFTRQRRARVIDDNQDSADTLAMMLELLGHDTRRLYDPRANCPQLTAACTNMVRCRPPRPFPLRLCRPTSMR